MLLRTHNATQNYEQASFILGRNLILPNELAGFGYNEEQLRFLSKTLPAPAKLGKMSKCNVVYPFIPGPPHQMSLLEVCDKLPKCFNSSGGWFAKSKERFSREEKVGPGWIALRAECRSQQRRSSSTSVAKIPNAAEIAWYAGIYLSLRRVHLFRGAMVISSSCASSSASVSIGHHAGTTGLHIRCYPADVSFSGINFVHVFKRSFFER